MVPLAKSSNDIDWQGISGSKPTTEPDEGHSRRPLGVASTLSVSSHGHRGRDYRLIATGEPVHPAPGTFKATLSAPSRRLNGRVVTGVALNAGQQRFTPVALATATNVAIHFDIGWDGDCEHC